MAHGVNTELHYFIAKDLKDVLEGITFLFTARQNHIDERALSLVNAAMVDQDEWHAEYTHFGSEATQVRYSNHEFTVRHGVAMDMSAMGML